MTRNIGNRHLLSYLEITLFAAAVALCAFLIGPARGKISARLAGFRDSAISRAEFLLKRSISYESMKTSLFNLIDIKNVTISGEDGETLSVSRVRVSWSLAELLSFLLNPAFATQAVHKVTLDNPVIILDLEKDKDILALFSKFSKNNSQETQKNGEKLYLAENTTLNIKNGQVQVRTGTDIFALERLNADAFVKNERIFFEGGFGTALSLDKFLKDLTNAPVKADADVEIAGSCGLDFQSLTARLSLTALKSDLADIKSLRFNATLAENVFSLASADERLPFDISARADIANKTLSANFFAENFSPSDIISLKGSLKNYQEWLKIKTSGSFSVIVDANSSLGEGNGDKKEKIRYTAKLSGVIPQNLPSGRAGFVIEGSGNEKAVDFKRLSLRTAYGDFGFEGGIGFSPLAPNGKIAVSGFTLSKKASASANLAVITRGKNISLFGDSIVLGNAVLRDPAVSLSLDKKGLIWAFSINELINGENLGGERKKFAADGAFDFSHKQQNLEASLTLDKIAASDILALAEPFADISGVSDSIKAIMEKTEISAEIFIDTDFKRFLYNAPEMSIQFFPQGEKNGEKVTAQLSLAGTDKRLELNEGRVDWAAGGLDAAFSADFADINNIAFGASISYADSKYSVEGAILDQNTVSLNGSYGISASFTMIDKEISGYLEAEQAPFPFQGKTANLSASASFRFSSLESWSVDISNINASNLTTPATAFASAGFSGYADQDGAVFSGLFFDDGDPLSGTARVSWKNNFSEITGGISLSGRESVESYALDFSCLFATPVKEGENNEEAGEVKEEKKYPLYTAELSGNNMKLARFVSGSYGAVLTGEAWADWESFENFSAKAVIESASAEISGARVEASGSAEFSGKEASLNNIMIKYEELIGNIPDFSMNLEEGSADGSIRFWGNLFEKKFDLDCGLEVSYKPVDSWLDIQRIAEDFKGRLNIGSIGFDTLAEDEPFSFAFSREGGSMSVSGGPQDMLRFQISNAGDFYAGLSAPFPVRGSVTGRIADETIDAVAPDLYVDLTALWKLIPPQNIIGVERGFVTASVEVRGPLNAPEFFGTAIGQSVDLTIPLYLAAPIKAVPIIVTLNGTEMSFGPIPASVGQGIGEVSGRFHFDRWLPIDFTIDITAPKETPLPFSFDISGIVAKGNVFGNLSVSMADRVIKVAGGLTAQDSEVTLNMEELEAQAVEEDVSFTYITDIMVRMDRKVEFLWPSVQLPIIRAYADLGNALKVESDSSTAKISLLGDIELRGGEIFYYERNFYLQSGTLMFNENEMKFDPHISASAETTDQNEDGPVTIALIIDNSPLSVFTVRLASNPPLSQVAILSLLGQSITGVSAENNVSGNQNSLLPSLTMGSDILARSIVGRKTEQVVRNILHLDMFSFRTPILQNLAFQLAGLQNQNNSEETNIEQKQVLPKRSSTAGNYLNNTSVFFGKYIGVNMFAQGRVTFRHDEYNQRTGGIELEAGGLKIEPDFGIEMKTPLFDIGWNIQPIHLENFFVDDMSFTLTWRKSF